MGKQRWDFHNFRIIEQTTGKTIAEVFKTSDRALIAAAPEMLKELKRLASILEDVDPEALQLTGWGLTCMLKPAREVIAKAEGRE